MRYVLLYMKYSAYYHVFLATFPVLSRKIDYLWDSACINQLAPTVYYQSYCKNVPGMLGLATCNHQQRIVIHNAKYININNLINYAKKKKMFDGVSTVFQRWILCINLQKTRLFVCLNSMFTIQCHRSGSVPIRRIRPIGSYNNPYRLQQLKKSLNFGTGRLVICLNF